MATQTQTTKTSLENSAESQSTSSTRSRPKSTNSTHYLIPRTTPTSIEPPRTTYNYMKVSKCNASASIKTRNFQTQSCKNTFKSSSCSLTYNPTGAVSSQLLIKKRPYLSAMSTLAQQSASLFISSSTRI